MQHTANAKHIAVNRRKRRGDHHEIQNPRSNGDTHMLEGQHERAALSPDLIPREDRHNHEQRAHVEHQNAPRHGVNGFRNRLLRIFSFSGGDTNNLNPAVGKHHQLERENGAHNPLTEEAAVAPQVVNTGRLAAVADTPNDDAEARHNHDDDGQHFEEGEPELQLAEDSDAHQVDAADDKHHAQHPNPVRHLGEPDAHIDAEGGDVGDGDNQDLEAVSPAGDVTRHRPEVILRVARKRATLRVVNRHLTQRAHDDKRHDAADQIGQQHAWPG